MCSIFSIIPSEFKSNLKFIPLCCQLRTSLGLGAGPHKPGGSQKWISVTTGHKKVPKMWFSTALKIFEYLLRGPCYQAKQSAGGGAAAGWSEKTPRQFPTPSSQLLFFLTSHRRRAIKYLSSCNKIINHLNKINHYQAIKVQ